MFFGIGKSLEVANGKIAHKCGIHIQSVGPLSQGVLANLRNNPKAFPLELL